MCKSIDIETYHLPEKGLFVATVVNGPNAVSSFHHTAATPREAAEYLKRVIRARGFKETIRIGNAQ